MNKITQIQTILGVSPDGVWGPVSQAALNTLVNTASCIHKVLASTFADPADVASFQKCKLKGGTDQECFSVGDNGIGKWGDDTTANIPNCALPPEDWMFLGTKARGAKVRVTANNKTVICELRDTMPHKANITNGCGLDLNPAAIRALGLEPPQEIPATWEWV